MYYCEIWQSVKDSHPVKSSELGPCSVCDCYLPKTSQLDRDIMSATQKLIHGGDIVTMDDHQPNIEAVAVRDGKITAVGETSFCRDKLDKYPEEINLKGSTLLPGFIDSHIHPTMMILYEMYPDVSRFSAFTEIEAVLAKATNSLSNKEWVIGLQFEEQYLKPPVLPNRHDLDRCCPDHPAILLKRDGHSLVANTKAIKMAGITCSTDDPEGGSIDREIDGFPAGSFRENAMQLIMSKISLPAMESIIKAADTVFKRISGFGITSVSAILQTDNEGIMGEQGAFDIPLMELLKDQIPFSMYIMLVAQNARVVVDLMSSPLHQESVGAGHRIGALKLWADGSFASCTAKMKEPFTDNPNTSGYLLDTPEIIYRRMVDAHKAGLQLAIHTIGDESTDICLELFDRLLKQHPRNNHRHRLEHVSIIDDESVAKMADLGLIASVQPLFIHSERDWLYKRLGKKRTSYTYPFRSFVDGGVIVSGSSDAPIESMNALQAIQCCVTRCGFEPQQSLSVQEAIKMFTLNAAYAQFEESAKGSISQGKRADFVILGDNPLNVPEESIQDIPIEKTICGGMVTHSKT